MSETDMQQANAEALANARLSANSANKVLYILRVEDAESPSKVRSFSVLKLTRNTTTLQVIGFETLDNNKTTKNNNKKKTQKQIDTYQKALETANKGDVNIVDIEFPWHRVINIQNVNYQHKALNIKK